MIDRKFSVWASLGLVVALVVSLGFEAQAVTVKRYPIPTADSGPASLVIGGDGNIWFVETRGNKIGRITPNGVITEFPLPDASIRPNLMVATSDGSLWFINRSLNNAESNKVGHITLDGMITYLELPSNVSVIAAGMNGSLWFGTRGYAKIIRLTKDGVISDYDFSGSGPGSVGTLAAGLNGDVWYTRYGSSSLPFSILGNMNANHQRSEIILGDFYTNNILLSGIGMGPDGNLWYTRSVRRPFSNERDIA